MKQLPSIIITFIGTIIICVGIFYIFYQRQQKNEDFITFHIIACIHYANLLAADSTVSTDTEKIEFLRTHALNSLETTLMNLANAPDKKHKESIDKMKTYLKTRQQNKEIQKASDPGR